MKRLKKYKFLILIFLSLGILTGVNTNSFANNKNIIIEDNYLENYLDNIPFYDYMLGSGDIIRLKVIGHEELSGEFEINSSGIIRVPRLNKIYVDGLTIAELEIALQKKFSKFMRTIPEVEIKLLKLKPIKIFISGEISNPGYYSLVINKDNNDENPSEDNAQEDVPRVFDVPTVFDVIKKAGGVTLKADLSNIEISRLIPVSDGGGRKKTKLNFLQLITDGDDTYNLKVFDKDVIHINKSDSNVKDQVLKTLNSNLVPDTVNVFISGSVETVGIQSFPMGTSLNQALIAMGGRKTFSGKIDFIRFSNETLNHDKRVINLNPKASIGTYSNPILTSGDVIRVRKGVFNSTVEVIEKTTSPFTGIYSIIRIFDN